MHARMPERFASVYRGKRFLLFQRILESSRFGYPGIVRGMIGGCRITGDVGVTGIFPPKFSGAIASMDELWKYALSSR